MLFDRRRGRWQLVAIAHAMHLRLRARRPLDIDAELRQRRNDQQRDKASQQFDKRLHIRAPKVRPPYA